MIDVCHVTKYYGQFQALKDVSFTVGQGEIVGFLGQNGAGKTTLMRILTTYLAPTKGKVLIAGRDVAGQPMAVRQQIGYLPENPPLYVNMDVRSYLRFAAQLKDIPAKEQLRQVDKAMSDCHLQAVQRKVIGTLSKGFKQRVGIAQAILNNPSLLILDEPTVGLDPVQIRQVRKLIQDLEHKRTVILSTHILSEIEQIAQRVLMVKEGRVIVDRPMADLLAGKKGGSPRSLEDAFIEAVAVDSISS